jgi:hypothetical protein
MSEPTSFDLLASPEKPKNRRMRGPDPLSRASRRRIIGALAAAAGRGNVEAAEALVRLSLTCAEGQRVLNVAARIALEQRK